MKLSAISLRVAVLCALSLSSRALSAEGGAFSASFGEYVPGEALGEKGARGGTWRVAEGAMATNVVECARAAMDYKGAVSFAASSSCTGNVERVKLAVFVDALQKMDIFVVDLSFIGWHILSVFTCGILEVWVLPYHTTARYKFMDDLMKAAN